MVANVLLDLQADSGRVLLVPVCLEAHPRRQSSTFIEKLRAVISNSSGQAATLERNEIVESI